MHSSRVEALVFWLSSKIVAGFESLEKKLEFSRGAIAHRRKKSFDDIWRWWPVYFWPCQKVGLYCWRWLFRTNRSLQWRKDCQFQNWIRRDHRNSRNRSWVVWHNRKNEWRKLVLEWIYLNWESWRNLNWRTFKWVSRSWRWWKLQITKKAFSLRLVRIRSCQINCQRRWFRWTVKIIFHRWDDNR